MSRPSQAPCCCSARCSAATSMSAASQPPCSASAAPRPGRLAHDEAAAADARGRLRRRAHRRAAAGHQQVVHALRQQHAPRQLVEAARCARRPAPLDVAGHMLLQRPGVDADACRRSSRSRARRSPLEHRAADARGASRECPPAARSPAGRRFEAGHLGAQEGEEVAHLAPAFDLAGGQLQRIGAVHRAAGALRICVTLTRHSPACFIGRRIAPCRAKRWRPLRCASAMRGPTSRQASPARASSTPATRNISVGYSISPCASPFSQGAPAQATGRRRPRRR